jgi:alkylhydroperoxidase family enzyme
MLTHKGHPPEPILSTFFKAGYTSEQSLEVIVGIATKMMSNFTNALAKTPLDKEVSHLKETE